MGIVGADINLTCTASGNAISGIQWWKDGLRITRGKEHVTQEGLKTKVFSNTLKLMKLDKKDADAYECRVFSANNTSWFWAAQTILRVQGMKLYFLVLIAFSHSSSS